jgi:hypothetical protein
MCKLNSACFAVRMVKSIMSQKALRIIYFPYAHSIITCIIFGGNLPYSIKTFRKNFSKKDNYYKLKE